MKENTFINLGMINLNKGKVLATDPCYEPVNGYNKTVAVKKGDYVCTAEYSDEGDWGRRVVSLIIRHKDFSDAPFIDEIGYCAVDSGQCGFFDTDYYNDNYGDDEYTNINSWYRRVCDMTMNATEGGVIEDLGVCTSSGFGDGCYSVEAAYEKEGGIGEIVGLKLIFIWDEEEDEW